MAQPEQLVVGGRYRLIKKIGSGAFGDIYLGESLNSGQEVAVKLESVKAKFPQLAYEYKLYKILAGGVGIPRVRWFGREADFNVLVMDLLGPSLEDIFNTCNRKLSLKSVLMIADQMIARIEFIHSKNYIHRDIKPDNFLLGLGSKANVVYAIDFGLVKKYRDPKTHQHIPYAENKNLTGTARYASLNTHLGIEQSRRDDLEAIGFVFMYFLRGSLPWQGLKTNTKKERYDKIAQKKQSTPIEVLCKGYPQEFATYLNYCRSLRFDDKPDYSYLRRLFRDLFFRENFQPDFVFDWTTEKPAQLESNVAHEIEEVDEKKKLENPNLAYLKYEKDSPMAVHGSSGGNYTDDNLPVPSPESATRQVSISARTRQIENLDVGLASLKLSQSANEYSQNSKAKEKRPSTSEVPPPAAPVVSAPSAIKRLFGFKK